MHKLNAATKSFSVSILLHLVLLVSVHQIVNFPKNKQNFSLLKAPSSMLSTLKIKSIEKYKAPTKVKKISKKKTLKKTLKKKNTLSNASKGKVKAGQNTAIANYLTKVRSEIIKYKYKNRIATKLKLKGKVAVQFDLKWPNQIENIKLVSKSKYKALDKSAIESIKRVDFIPSFPKEIEVKKIPITLNMVFE